MAAAVAAAMILLREPTLLKVEDVRPARAWEGSIYWLLAGDPVPGGGVSLPPPCPIRHPEPTSTYLRVPVPRPQPTPRLLIFHCQLYLQDTLPCPGLAPPAGSSGAPGLGESVGTLGDGASSPPGVATAPGRISMETTSPGPRRIRINPFSSSSSTFSSRAEGRRTMVGAGTFSGSGICREVPMGVDSLQRSCESQEKDQCPSTSSSAYSNPAPTLFWDGLICQAGEDSLRSLARPTPPAWPSPHPSSPSGSPVLCGPDLAASPVQRSWPWSRSLRPEAALSAVTPAHGELPPAARHWHRRR